MGIQKSASSNNSKKEQCKQRQFSQDKHAQLAKRDEENCFIVVKIVTSSLPYMMASLHDRKQTNSFLSYCLSGFQILFQILIKSSTACMSSLIFGELVFEYNTTLKSLLDRHAPLKTKTITLRPTALWYTEELRSEKKKRRAFERRWRSSKLESDYSRFKEQCLRVNALIKKTKVDYYSGIIKESSNNPRTLFNTVNKLLYKGVPAEYPSGCASDGEL